jgi:peptidoglycan-N-acetylmuramic acid deacetylase
MNRLFVFNLLALLIFSSLFPFSVAAYGWGYKKSEDGALPEIGSYKEVLEEYGAYYADPSGEKNIYLTFDNGYEEGYTPQVLDVLKEKEVPATFFVTGHYVETEPELVSRMVDEGHIIGNHSYHHPDFSVLTKEAMKKELDELEQKVSEVSDQKELKFLRPPKGIFSEDSLRWTKELGYIHIFWSIAFKDWETASQKGWEYAYEEVMGQIHPGAIILLHAVSKDNAEALEKLITDLEADGYVFKSLDDLVLRDEMPKVLHGL